MNLKMTLSLTEASKMTTDEVIRNLKSGLDGLSTTETSVRRSIFGFNEFSVKAGDPLWKKYLDQFVNPFICLLLASAVISVLMGQFDDAMSITLAIVIVVTVGFVQEYRSEKTLDRMGALLPPTCRCIRDGKVESILARYLIPGDVVELGIGDRIPADLRLLDCHELSVDESSFSGETDPIIKSTNPDSKSNICFMGTLVSNGRGRGIVVATGEDSAFGEVFKMMKNEEKPRTPLQESMDKLGKQLSIYSLTVIAMIILIGVLWRRRPLLEMFNVGVSLAVAAIPEGLPIVVTVTLALGVMRMANRNAIVKRLPTVEALGCVDFICSDKTGTLTTNQMSVSSIATPTHLENDDTLDHDNNKIPHDLNVEAMTLIETAAICNNAVFSSSGIILGNPTEVALLNFAQRFDLHTARDRYTRIDEIPFSSDRKYMSVKCVSIENREDERIFVKGAVDNVLEMCTIFQGRKLDSESCQKILMYSEEFAKQNGLRVLGFATSTTVPPLITTTSNTTSITSSITTSTSAKELQFIGIIGLHDPPRPMVRDSIQTLKRSGVQISMITGDSRATALAIASTLNINEDDDLRYLSGEDLDRLSDSELARISDNISVYYRASPRHKLRIVKALQSNGHVVAMTGDGVNDGVAVKKADVGISMGITGTDVCKEASDMILLDDDFSTILAAVEEGKCIFYNIRNFIRFQLSTSIAALILLSLSTLLDIPNPLNPMQILWINVIMDGPPAQSLGLEPVDHEVLKRPPRNKSEQILTKSLLWNSLLSATVIICGTLWVFKEMMEDDGQITARDTTMTFTCFVFFDMFNALTCRSQNRLIYDIGFTTNRVFCVAVGLSVAGQLAVIYLPPLQYIFQTEPLSFADLVLLVVLSSSVFFISEFKKILESRSFFKRNVSGIFKSPRTQKSAKSSSYSV